MDLTSLHPVSTAWADTEGGHPKFPSSILEADASSGRDFALASQSSDDIDIISLPSLDCGIDQFPPRSVAQPSRAKDTSSCIVGSNESIIIGGAGWKEEHMIMMKLEALQKQMGELSTLNLKIDKVLEVIHSFTQKAPFAAKSFEDDQRTINLEEMVRRSNRQLCCELGKQLKRCNSDSILEDKQGQTRRVLEVGQEAVQLQGILLKRADAIKATPRQRSQQKDAKARSREPPLRFIPVSHSPSLSKGASRSSRDSQCLSFAEANASEDGDAEAGASGCARGSHSLVNVPKAKSQPFLTQAASEIPPHRQPLPMAKVKSEPLVLGPAEGGRHRQLSSQSSSACASIHQTTFVSGSAPRDSLPGQVISMIPDTKEEALASVRPPQDSSAEGTGVVPLETNRRQRNQRLIRSVSSGVRSSKKDKEDKGSRRQDRIRADLEVLPERQENPASQDSKMPFHSIALSEDDSEGLSWEALEKRLPAIVRPAHRLPRLAFATFRSFFLKLFSTLDGALLRCTALRSKRQAPSRSAAFAVEAAVILTLLTSAVWLIFSGFGLADGQVTWTERILAVGVLLALLMTLWSSRRHRRNRKHLRKFGDAADFSRKWDSQTAGGAFMALLWWSLAVGLKLLHESASDAPLNTAAFAFVSLGLLVVIHSIVNSCLGLILFIDSYCHSVEQQDIQMAMEDWNVIQATTRDFGETLQGAVIILLGTFLVCCVALVADAHKDSQVQVMRSLPCGILLPSIIRIVFVASLVTEKCLKVHSFVNSLQGLDRARQHLVEYIRRSGAAFYIYEVCFTGTVGWRCLYSAGMLAFLSDRICAALSLMQAETFFVFHL